MIVLTDSRPQVSILFYMSNCRVKGQGKHVKQPPVGQSSFQMAGYKRSATKPCCQISLIGKTNLIFLNYFKCDTLYFDHLLTHVNYTVFSSLRKTSNLEANYISPFFKNKMLTLFKMSHDISIVNYSKDSQNRRIFYIFDHLA